MLPQILLGFERLQAIARGLLLAKQYQMMRQRMVQLQALCRGYLVRQQVQAKKRAVVVIQAHARGMAARRNFRQQKANVGGRCPLGPVGDAWDPRQGEQSRGVSGNMSFHQTLLSPPCPKLLLQHVGHLGPPRNTQWVAWERHHINRIVLCLEPGN